jgi:hypothetical protein
MTLNFNKSNVFKPIDSKGGIYSSILLIIISVLFISISIALNVLESEYFFYIFTVIILFIFGIVTYGYFNMAYILKTDKLILRWAFFKKSIPYDKILEISRISGKIKAGIRIGGVGIPGYLQGKFKLLLDGGFKTISLYSTKINHLIVIKSKINNKLRLFGITPKDSELMIDSISKFNSNIKITTIDTDKQFDQDRNLTEKNKKISKLIFIIGIIALIIIIIYFAINYNLLPETDIPLHWGIDGKVDRWGSKTELIGYILFISLIGLFLNLIFYISLNRKTEIGKTKLGYIIMIIPLILNLIFLFLTIFIIQITINSI